MKQDDFSRGRHVDIELTNKCNTSCVFCPRHKTPRLGFMNVDTFNQTVRRIEELERSPSVSFCSLGEPLMHNQIADYLSCLTDRDIDSHIASNGALLTGELSSALIDAGLRHMWFSVSGLYDTYERIHRLKFQVVKDNILRFLKLAEGRCEVIISIVVWEENQKEIEEMKSFWKSFGISKFYLFNRYSRGGAIAGGLAFRADDRHRKESMKILADRKLTPFCLLPFSFVNVGWDGKWCLCSNDFERKMFFGDVFQQSLREATVAKRKWLSEGSKVPCSQCDFDPVTRVAEIFSNMERNEAGDSELEELLADISAKKILWR